MPILYQHRAALQALISSPQADQDLKEMLTDEIKRVDDALAAPSRPFVRNFEQETETEKVREPTNAQSKGAAAASSQQLPAAGVKTKRPHGFTLSN